MTDYIQSSKETSKPNVYRFSKTLVRTTKTISNTTSPNTNFSPLLEFWLNQTLRATSKAVIEHFHIHFKTQRTKERFTLFFGFIFISIKCNYSLQFNFSELSFLVQILLIQNNRTFFPSKKRDSNSTLPPKKQGRRKLLNVSILVGHWPLLFFTYYSVIT